MQLESGDYDQRIIIHKWGMQNLTTMEMNVKLDSLKSK